MTKSLKVTLCVLFLALLTVGCATKGRVSVLDLDLRTPEQITAYQNEADIVYTPDTNTTISSTTAVAKEFPTFTWDILVKLVEVFKGRIKILSVEWKK